MATKKLSSVTIGWSRPDFSSTVKTNKNFKSNFNSAMLYAHYELTAIDLKKEVVKYLKSLDAHHPLLARVKDIHENRFTTVGKYMYILNHKGDIPDDILPKLMPALEKVIVEEEAKASSAAKNSKEIKSVSGDDSSTSVPVKATFSIQDRLKEKARETAGEVEGWIDDFLTDKKSPIRTVEDFVTLFKSADLKSAHMPHMRFAFEKRRAEFALLAEGTDKELSEGYSNFGKVEIRKFNQMLDNLFSACDMLQEVAKAERAPRKKKPISVEKLVAKLKYKKEDSSLGIASVNPTQIIGARELWVYNTKTRKLSHYKSIDVDGLSVKGASLLNFSTDSVEKTLRKPAEALAEFKKASKVKLRTFLKELTTVDVPCNGKINEHQILLRVDK